MEGFTALDCRPQKDDTPRPQSQPRATERTYPGDGYAPAPPPPAKGAATSYAGDDEKYKKFRERSPNAGAKKTVAAPVTKIPEHHEGEYRVAMRGGGGYWAREKPILKNNVYSFTQPNGVLMAVKKAEVEAIDSPAPPAPPETPK